LPRLGHVPLPGWIAFIGHKGGDRRVKGHHRFNSLKVADHRNLRA
jgi:hypothetical protein